MKRLSDVKPGQGYISASEWNRMTQEVYRLSRMTAEMPLSLQNAGNNPQLRYIDPCINAKITSDGWTEVQPKGDGTWNTLTGGRSGKTGFKNPAYEVNGGAAPVGTFVKLYPGLNDEYLYWYGASDILALIYAKTYTLTTFPAYSWLRVIDSDDPVALSYGTDSNAGRPGDFPIYSEQDIDVVVTTSATYGPSDPGTMENDDSQGNTAWSSGNNAKVSDDTYATCTIASGQESQYLVATNFSIAVPTGNMIAEVIVEVERKGTTTDLIDTEVKLIKGGVITGNNKAGNTATPTSDAYQSYDYNPPRWGVKLTVADVNAANFGVAIRYRNNGTNPQTVSVDHIRISIVYATFDPACVVRIRKGSGDYYLLDHEPRWEIVKIDPESDPITIEGNVYFPGFLLRYDQYSKTLVAVDDILIIDLSPVG